MLEKLYKNFASKGFVLGIVVLISAVPLVFLIHFVNKSSRDNPEKGIMILGAIFAVILLLPIIAGWILNFGREKPLNLGLVLVTTICVILLSIYFYWVSFYILFPADIFIWAENDVINDIIKLRVGYPFYSSCLNNDSQVYPPGTQIIIHSIAWLLGNSKSIPLYRIIQLGFNLLTAFFAAGSCNYLIQMSLPSLSSRKCYLWNFLFIPLFFLVATNNITNPFVHYIHNDSLFQLAVVIAYWLLLKYSLTQKLHILVIMAVLAGFGFLIKQNFIIWILLYSMYFLFFDNPRSIIRLILFNTIALILLLTVVTVCFLIWREDFIYWVFTVLGNRHIFILRSIQHVFKVWPYLTIGLLGGLTVIQGKKNRQLLGIWFVWLLLFAIGAYTSGAAWTLSHIGPASVIAGIWFVAAIIKFQTTPNIINSAEVSLSNWLNTAIAVVILCLLFNGLGFIRIPLRPFSHDANRYIREIENEFDGESPENILLDVGSWIYLKNEIVMKDRATAIGDRGFQGMGGFSGMIKRIEERRYSKILLRGFHLEEFWYDNTMWPESSDIKKALQEHYDEKSTIRGISKTILEKDKNYLFRDISVLIPKPD